MFINSGPDSIEFKNYCSKVCKASMLKGAAFETQNNYNVISMNHRTIYFVPCQDTINEALGFYGSKLLIMTCDNSREVNVTFPAFVHDFTAIKIICIIGWTNKIKFAAFQKLQHPTSCL